ISHLRSCYRNNVKAFGDGRYGALLVAEPGIQQYAQDGGSEMQVNEVIVGSSWILAVSLEEYGLSEEAKQLTEAMFRVIREYGLQFRTPAAWNRTGRFRAPMNLRPLAVWLLP
ncbi:MAG: GH116 family glycosyl hydrolase, partial [Clostridium sp.]|nr:GH116 family glycosyl hydrolase [Clostridium sp.]